MVARNEGKSVEKEAPVKDDAIKRFRKIIKERKKYRRSPCRREEGLSISQAAFWS